MKTKAKGFSTAYDMHSHAFHDSANFIDADDDGVNHLI